MPGFDYVLAFKIRPVGYVTENDADYVYVDIPIVDPTPVTGLPEGMHHNGTAFYAMSFQNRIREPTS